MEFKTQADGSIIFDRANPPPSAFMYYSQDPQNRWRFIPDFEPCRHRQKSVEVRACGKLSVCWSCTLKTRIVNVSQCEECTDVLT